MKFLLLLFICITSNVLASRLNYSVAEVVKVLNQIKIKCPPSECLYIGIGRSPTLFTTALRMQPGNRVVDLPLTDFRYELSEIGGKVFSARSLTKDQLGVLFEHFDNYLSEHKQAARILVMDFSFTGSTIASAVEHCVLSAT